jgi:hypothetical protein
MGENSSHSTLTSLLTLKTGKLFDISLSILYTVRCLIPYTHFPGIGSGSGSFGLDPDQKSKRKPDLFRLKAINIPVPQA